MGLTWVGSGERTILGLSHSKTEEHQNAGNNTSGDENRHTSNTQPTVRAMRTGTEDWSWRKKGITLQNLNLITALTIPLIRLVRYTNSKQDPAFRLWLFLIPDCCFLLIRQLSVATDFGRRTCIFNSAPLAVHGKGNFVENES